MKFLKPQFWDKNYLTFQSIILYPFTFIIDLKQFFDYLIIKPNKYSEIKTICVGNIYIGGTGKTPLVDFIAKKFRGKFKTAIIKKKYLNHLDEKKLLEKNNKVFFKKKRITSLLEAIQKKFDLVVFDDGLQDNSIKYDLKIVCFNSFSLAGNELRIPAGPLREGLINLKKYDAVFITGKEINREFRKKIRIINPNIPIFLGEYVSTNYIKYKKNKYLIFCGIGNPVGFKQTLEKYKINFNLNLIYPDHYIYSSNDIKKIKEIAKNKKLKILTTEKDYNRIPKKLRKNINYLKVKLKIKNQKDFNKFITKHI
tara:strand:- start:1083 stop:2015 length:933 start_codon:yes stop_codon:yes gene_type:complete